METAIINEATIVYWGLGFRVWGLWMGHLKICKWVLQGVILG